MQGENSECGMCKGEVKEGEKGVQCDCCGIWFHGKCVSVDHKLYIALTNFKPANDSGLHWYCGRCNKGFLELKSELAVVKVKQVEMEEGLKKMMADLENWKRENGKDTVLKVMEERE